MAGLQNSNIYWKGLYLVNIFDAEVGNVHPKPKQYSTFDLENSNTDSQGQLQSSYGKCMKVYLHKKFERVILNSITTMDLNANSHLTLKPGIFRAKVNNMGCNL